MMIKRIYFFLILINSLAFPQYFTDVYDYYNELRNNPNNKKVRYDLAKILLISGYIEDAYKQIGYFSEEDLEDAELFALKERIVFSYEATLNSRDNSLNTDDSTLVLLNDIKNISKEFISIGNYSKAESLLSRGIIIFPKDAELYYLISKSQLLNKNYEGSLNNIIKAVDLSPNNRTYSLFRRKIGAKFDYFSGYGTAALEEVYSEQEYNTDLGIVLSKKLALERSIDKSKQILDKIKNNIEKGDLFSILSEINKKSEIIFASNTDKLSEAKNYLNSENCEKATEIYEELFNEIKNDKNSLLDFAKALECTKRYKDAINVYNDLLNRNYDKEVVLRKINVYMKNDEVFNAFETLEEAEKKLPSDFELSLVRGDLYEKINQFNSASKLYNLLLETNPNSFELFERLDRLPTQGKKSSILGSYFKFEHLYKNGISIIPFTKMRFRSDNYESYGAGLGIEFYWLDFLASDLSWSRNSISINNFGQNYSLMKAGIKLIPKNYLEIKASFGELGFSNDINMNEWEIDVKIYPSKYGNFAINYLNSDALRIYEEANLVFNRLRMQRLNFEGEYIFIKNIRGVILKGIYNFYYSDNNVLYNREIIETTNNNIGNDFDSKVGFPVLESLYTGLGFYFSDYRYTIDYYYSPQVLYQYYLWTNYNFIIDSSIIKFGLMGGYLPSGSNVVYGIDLDAKIKIEDNYSLHIEAGYSKLFRYLVKFEDIFIRANLILEY